MTELLVTETRVPGHHLGAVDLTGGLRNGLHGIFGLRLVSDTADRDDVSHWMTPGETYTLTVDRYGQVAVTGASWMRRRTLYRLVLDDHTAAPPRQLMNPGGPDVPLHPGRYLLVPGAGPETDWEIHTATVVILDLPGCPTQ